MLHYCCFFLIVIGTTPSDAVLAIQQQPVFVSTTSKRLSILPPPLSSLVSPISHSTSLQSSLSLFGWMATPFRKTRTSRRKLVVSITIPNKGMVLFSSFNEHYRDGHDGDNRKDLSIEELYRTARQQRIMNGHMAAQPLYRNILLHLQQLRHLQKQHTNGNQELTAAITTAEMEYNTYKNNTIHNEMGSNDKKIYYSNYHDDDLTISTRLAASDGKVWYSWKNSCRRIYDPTKSISERNIINDSSTSVSHALLKKEEENGCSSSSSRSSSSSSSSSSRGSRIDDDVLQKVRTYFHDCNYTSYAINQLFVANNNNSEYCNTIQSSICPLYIKQATPTILSSSNVVVAPTKSPQNAMECFLHLFLLGLAVPKDIVQWCIPNEIIQILTQYNLIQLCDYNSNLVLGLVMIYPIDYTYNYRDWVNHASINKNDVASQNKNAYIVTDWHPRVLNTVSIEDNDDKNDSQNNHTASCMNTTVHGSGGGDAVMYIGPDSIALVQHWTMMMNCISTTASTSNSIDSSMEERKVQQHSVRTAILDLCCGSGIQAIVSLLLQKNRRNEIRSNDDEDISGKNSTTRPFMDTSMKYVAVCVDTNIRALRFTHFSSILNGLSSDEIVLVHGNVLTETGTVVNEFDKENKVQVQYEMESSAVSQKSKKDLVTRLQDIASKINTDGSPYYDQILANPPFLPVPTLQRNDSVKDGLILGYAGSNRTCKIPIEKEAEKDKVNIGKSPYEDECEKIGRTIRKRHGLFSSGGPSGEEVLASVLRLSRKIVKEDGGFVAIVSEFFLRRPITNHATADCANNNIMDKGSFPFGTNTSINDTGFYQTLHSDEDSMQTLLLRLQSYYYSDDDDDDDDENKIHADVGNDENYSATPATCSMGLLFTNQYPIPSTVYAERRADTYEEYELWIEHLQQKQNIIACSPGLLYIQKSIQSSNKCKHNFLDTTEKSSNIINSTGYDVAAVSSTSTTTTVTTTESADYQPLALSLSASIRGQMNELRPPWTSVHVNKSHQGSIWTPTNHFAIAFTQSLCKKYFFD